MSIRTATATLAALCALVVATTVARAATQAPAAAALTPADAAPFMGDWVVQTKGDYGENRFALSVKAAGDKVTLAISSETMPEKLLTDLTKRDASLVAYYEIPYEGNQVPVVLTLTPSAEGLDAAFDYASGAYVEYGKATKKTAARP